jgi:hypothetical protein
MRARARPHGGGYVEGSAAVAQADNDIRNDRRLGPWKPAISAARPVVPVTVAPQDAPDATPDQLLPCLVCSECLIAALSVVSGVHDASRAVNARGWVLNCHVTFGKIAVRRTP